MNLQVGIPANSANSGDSYYQLLLDRTHPAAIIPACQECHASSCRVCRITSPSGGCARPTSSLMTATARPTAGGCGVRGGSGKADRTDAHTAPWRLAKGQKAEIAGGIAIDGSCPRNTPVDGIEKGARAEGHGGNIGMIIPIAPVAGDT